MFIPMWALLLIPGVFFTLLGMYLNSYSAPTDDRHEALKNTSWPIDHYVGSLPEEK